MCAQLLLLLHKRTRPLDVRLLLPVPFRVARARDARKAATSRPERSSLPPSSSLIRRGLNSCDARGSCPTYASVHGLRHRGGDVGACGGGDGSRRDSELFLRRERCFRLAISVLFLRPPAELSLVRQHSGNSHSGAPVARSCPRFQPARFPPRHNRPSSAGSAALLHESSRARTMPTGRILTCRCDMTLVGRGRSSDSGSHSRGRPHSPAQLDSGREGHRR